MWTSLGFSLEVCPASGQVASIPEPWAGHQYGTGLATVSDFQWHLPHRHFFMAPIKSYLICTETKLEVPGVAQSFLGGNLGHLL